MSSNKKQKAPVYTTPKGVAMYPWLNTPDTKTFNGQETKPAYKVSLRLGGEDAEKLKAHIDALVEESYEEAVAKLEKRIEEGSGKKKAEAKKKLEELERAYPYEPDYDDEGDETGDLVFKFKQNAQIPRKGKDPIDVKIRMFDTKRNLVDVKVFGGTILKVSYTTRSYLMDSTNKAGVSLDLRAVQIIELVTGGGGSDNAADYGFGDEEGSFEDDTPGSEFGDELGNEVGDEDNGEAAAHADF